MFIGMTIVLLLQPLFQHIPYCQDDANPVPKNSVDGGG